MFVLRTYYKSRQRGITIHDSSDYYKLRQQAITIHDRYVITTIHDRYYNSRQVLLQLIHDRYYNSGQNRRGLRLEARLGDLVLTQTSLLFICRSYNASFCFCFRDKRALKRWQRSQQLSQYWPKEERDLKSSLVRSVRFVFASLNVPLNPASFFICTLVHCALINSSWNRRLTEKRSGITKIINN